MKTHIVNNKKWKFFKNQKSGFLLPGGTEMVKWEMWGPEEPGGQPRWTSLITCSSSSFFSSTSWPSICFKIFTVSCSDDGDCGDGDAGD